MIIDLINQQTLSSSHKYVLNDIREDLRAAVDYTSRARILDALRASQ